MQKTNNLTSLKATWYYPLNEVVAGEKYEAIKAVVSYQEGGYSSRKGIQLSINRVTVEPCNGYSMESNMLGNGARVMLCELSRKSAKAYSEAVAYFDAIAETTLKTIADANPSADCYAQDDIYRTVMQPMAGILNK